MEHSGLEREMFRCYNCPTETDSYEDIIHHSVVIHPNNPLSIRQKLKKNGNWVFQSIHYKVIPNEQHQNGKTILPIAESKRIRIVDFDEETEMHVPKRWKGEKPTLENVTICNEKKTKSEISTQTKSTVVIDVEEDQLKDVGDIAQMIPDVVNTLREYDHLREWKLLFILMVHKALPKSNIAYKLFLDVVRWFSLKNTSTMRYDSVVKRFWRTGYLLFKGKFLRFMSGLKNLGQVVSNEYRKGDLLPSSSAINFVVPSKHLLIEESALDCCKVPGIMTSLIDSVATTDKEKRCSYKISVDLKKLNPGGEHGDVNCFGYENSPTFTERQERLDRELTLVNQTKNVQNTIEMPVGLVEIVNKLSLRVKDLRQILLKRQYTFNKLKLQCGEKWKESKMAFVLSAVQTTIHETKQCIASSIDCVSRIMSILSGRESVTERSCVTTNIKMNDIPNLVCLTDANSATNTSKLLWPDFCPLVKQTSSHWHEIRSKARVTGSTAYSALGFDTLKAQRSHFDHVIKGKPMPAFDNAALKRIQHGCDCEVNAVATLTSVLMPALYQDFVFHEEGCYVLSHNSTPLCVVSPDGSLRKNGKALLGVEVKCPYPEESFVCKVMYEVPKRYVLQVLLEMKVLEVNELLFVCWMPESTTVIKVTFCEELWTKLWNLIVAIYGQDVPSIPTTFHPLTKALKSDIAAFTKENCSFLCEIPSITGQSCTHPNEHNEPFCAHIANTDMLCTQKPKSQDYFDNTLYKAEDCIKKSYNLSRDIAKQIIVFMLSDLDRVYKPEIPHAVPIAYGMTGYGISVEQVGAMLTAIRRTCNKIGLNIIAECFDGAFVRLATRGENNQPLTTLQLSKDVWSIATKVTKQEQIKTFSEIGLASGLKSLIDVDEFFCTNINTVYCCETRQINGPIIVGLPKTMKHIFKTPTKLKEILQKKM